MCAQCAIVATAAVSGARSWIAARRFEWMTPARMKTITITLVVAGLAASSVGFSGSTPPSPAHTSAHSVGR